MSTGDLPWVFDEYLLFGIGRIERLCATVPPATALHGQLASQYRESVPILPPRTVAGDCEALMNMPSGPRRASTTPSVVTRSPGAVRLSPEIRPLLVRRQAAAWAPSVHRCPP
jgi:hypothetical protein